MHKGDWELQVWCDGKRLVIALTDCCSGCRGVHVGRSVEKKSVKAVAVEGVGRYAIYGRSCTDGGDQLRKKIQLAARRVLRQGPKGALFDAEIGLVNGSIIYKWFHEGATVWDFCTRFYDEVVSEVQLVRKRFSQRCAQRALVSRAAAALRSSRSRARVHALRLTRL